MKTVRRKLRQTTRTAGRGDAFVGCSRLASILIPESVTSIGRLTFEGCRSLTAVTFLGDAPQRKSSEGKILNGKTEGLWIHWHMNGEKLGEQNYKWGEPLFSL